MSFLVPDGWHFYEEPESGSGTSAYFFSREQIIDGGQFKTGLSINVIFDVKTKSKISADDYALHFIKELMDKHKTFDS